MRMHWQRPPPALNGWGWQTEHRLEMLEEVHGMLADHEARIGAIERRPLPPKPWLRDWQSLALLAYIFTVLVLLALFLGRWITFEEVIALAAASSS